MRKLLLHIGTGKTGSTSIQRTMADPETAAALPEVGYPRLKGSSHNHLAGVYKPPERWPRKLKSERVRAQDEESYRRELEGYRDAFFRVFSHRDNVVVSSEYLSGFNRAEVAALRRDVERLGVDRVRVLAYVRSPAPYYLSFVQQQLKASAVFSSPDRFRYGFMDALTLWRDYFPDVAVRHFSPDRLGGGDVVEDFLVEVRDFFALNHDVIRTAPSPSSNVSLSAEAMIALQRYRQSVHADNDRVFTRDTDRLVNLLRRTETQREQTPAQLDPDVRTLVMRNHAPDVHALRDDFGVDLEDPTIEDLPAAARRRGEARAGDVTTILRAYDPQVVDELLFRCLRTAIDEAVAARP